MKIPIQISDESREPIYHQIENQLRTLIAGGQLPPGTPLPSIRALASELGCSVITTRRVYQNLEMSGFIKTVQGKGTFVREIDHEQLQKTKQKVIYDAFEKAIEQGVQLGCTEEELKSIFEELVRKNFH
ncbi:GntR family transcriptional regulator [Melghiribacillus thermohalophilus]|uniref:GntR family transcriptional regulator n=1 Tax=Melghiribacillus thermohalophilus TaxID=1324956 RepID=A0A4R3N2S2_9BACI|nr:GntR family transcriptional regulator [Melghiribacillus thermohalophilus]TCT23408.1 GntR family transcriptional regulator [Melghiribacillus thermohalophilus]